MESLIFEKKDGTRYALNDFGIRVVEFEPESLESLNETTLIPGSHYITTPVGYGVRMINASFRIHSKDLIDYALFRMEIFNLFVQDDDFYIIDEKDLSLRWHVRSDGKFSLDRALRTGNFDISFLCINPYAISDKSTLELNGKKLWDENLFYWNGVIDWDSELKYIFNRNNFDVSNLGNAVIDSRNQKFVLRIKALTSSGITIKNVTTGDEYIFNGTLGTNDTLVINGTRSFKNGVSVFRDTNRSALTMKPGVNTFEITGAAVQEISFDFNYLFK